MKKTKQLWIDAFRKEAEKVLLKVMKLNDRNKKSDAINKAIKKHLNSLTEQAKRTAQEEGWSNTVLLNEILLITYSSYIVMLEYRNKVWPYDYMTFSRRIGELWEPFCKLPFEYPIKQFRKISPPNFDDVQASIKQHAIEYINSLDISTSERSLLTYYYGVPWSLVASGEIKLGLDLHFEQDGIHYNCDFKSGFSSNEKGNTNRLLLVGSIYHSLGNNEKNLLFVRQKEDQNNHYLQRLKNSPYWDCYCADKCYAKIVEFTGFDLRKWLDNNVDWENDISDEFRKHLVDNDLIGYLTW